MSEQSSKKIKIFNLAKELNLSSETIIEFLKKKGFDVKSHMSTVTDEMMPLIMGHFKKDKEVAERHHRKLQEFRSTRKKESPDKTEKSEKAEKKTAVKEKVPLQIIEEEQPKVGVKESDLKIIEEISRSRTEEKIKEPVEEVVSPEARRVEAPPVPIVPVSERRGKAEKAKEERPSKEKREHRAGEQYNLH